MFASKLSVQLGPGCNWRISILKVRPFAVRKGFHYQSSSQIPWTQNLNVSYQDWGLPIMLFIWSILVTPELFPHSFCGSFVLFRRGLPGVQLLLRLVVLWIRKVFFCEGSLGTKFIVFGMFLQDLQGCVFEPFHVFHVRVLLPESQWIFFHEVRESSTEFVPSPMYHLASRGGVEAG